MIEQSLKDKITKIYELVNRGGTEGERKAAKNQLDKILAKHKLDDSFLDSIGKELYNWKYNTELEVHLLSTIITNFTATTAANCSKAPWKKQISGVFEYNDYIVVECMYEYFRRHMKIQWKLVCRAELKKCRKAKTRNQRRKILQGLFFDRYAIESNLVKPEQIRNVEVTNSKERADRMILQGVQGGNYNKQVMTNLLIEN